MMLGKHSIRCLILLVIATVLGCTLLMLVQLVPSTYLMAHVPSALEVFTSQEMQRPALIDDINATRVDYYSDAHLYQLSLGQEGVSVLANALYPRAYINPLTTDEWNLSRQVEGLNARLSGVAPNANNGRYWNGFIVPMRLIGGLMSYPALRILNAALLGVLLLVAGMQINRVLGLRLALAFLISLILMSTWVVPFCLDYVSVFFIMGLGILAVLRLARTGRLLSWGPELFLILGIGTAFFDLFTAPLVTLGFPLVVALLCLQRSKHRSDAQAMIRFTLLWICAWLIGFAGFWAIKILLTSVLFGSAVLSDAAERVASYSDLDRHFPVLQQIFGVALPANLGTMLGNRGQDVWLAIGSAWMRTACAMTLLLAPLGVVAIRTMRRIDAIGTTWILVVVGMLPFLRMMVTSIHSDWNSFFTFREFGVSFFAIYAFWILVMRYLDRKAQSTDAGGVDVDSCSAAGID